MLEPDAGQALAALDIGQLAILVHIEDEPEKLYAQLVAAGLRVGMTVQVLEKTRSGCASSPTGRNSRPNSSGSNPQSRRRHARSSSPPPSAAAAAGACVGGASYRDARLKKLGLEMQSWDFAVALAGNPNTGKSTVFNSLTGLRQHIGNWPGKTVARAEGGFEIGGKRFKLIDLPGTYSLIAGSPDEMLARDFLLFGEPDVTVAVVDAGRLERNLNLALQVLVITDRVVICLNLVDEARRHGWQMDARRLSRVAFKLDGLLQKCRRPRQTGHDHHDGLRLQRGRRGRRLHHRLPARTPAGNHNEQFFAVQRALAHPDSHRQPVAQPVQHHHLNHRQGNQQRQVDRAGLAPALGVRLRPHPAGGTALAPGGGAPPPSAWEVRRKPAWRLPAATSSCLAKIIRIIHIS